MCHRSRRQALTLISTALLLAPLPASARRYKQLDGVMYFVVLNADDVVRRQTSDLIADVGRFLGVLDSQVTSSIMDGLKERYVAQGVGHRCVDSGGGLSLGEPFPAFTRRLVASDEVCGLVPL